jgi:hypothetical protein
MLGSAGAGFAADMDPGAIAVQVRATRTLGTVRGVTHGLVLAEHEGTELVTRQDLDAVVPGPAAIHIDPARLLAFRDGWRIGAEGSRS